jgi:hypothetical protein
MAKKPASKAAKSPPVFSLGDRVEILHFGPGRITELRGPLGPGGAQVYRVLYRRKPKAAYIEVLGSQLRPAKIVKRPKPAGSKSPPIAGTSNGVEAPTGG